MAYAHPMFRLLLAHPELIAEHAGAYGELLRGDLQAAGAAWRRRMQLQVLAGGALLAGVVLLGQAAMWWAVLPDRLWLPMLAVPALPLLVGAVAAWAAARPTDAEPWAALRRQLSADLAMIRETAPRT